MSNINLDNIFFYINVHKSMCRGLTFLPNDLGCFPSSLIPCRQFFFQMILTVYYLPVSCTKGRREKDKSRANFLKKVSFRLNNRKKKEKKNKE